MAVVLVVAVLIAADALAARALVSLYRSRRLFPRRQAGGWRRGAKCLTILQPMLVTRRRLTARERAALPPARLTEGYRRFQEAARQSQRQAEPLDPIQIRWVDWTHLLDESSEEMYSDVVHYTDRGIEAIARQMAKDIAAHAAHEAAAVVG